MTDGLSEKTSIIDHICGLSASEGAEAGLPDELRYWESVRDAHDEGKKLIFINGPVPTEIIYAMDCVPLYLDLLPSRVSEDAELTSRLINLAEARSKLSLCSLQMLNSGILISGELGLTPDAYITLPISCDSARTACVEMSRFIDAPAFHFDIPLRNSESSLRYIKMQLEKMISFLEEITGVALDWEKVKARMELYNRSAGLLDECSGLRSARPCPLSAHTTVLNELMNAFGPTKNMAELLLREAELCRKRSAEGLSPCLGGEKHRVLLIHNLNRQAAGLSSFMEKDYGAVTVADGFCFARRELFSGFGDRDACLNIMCRRMQSGAMAHGAGVPGEELLKSIDDIIGTYTPDVFIFLGNRGCRHAWAMTKMVSDALQNRYGLPMLMLDVDNTDFRYKSEKELCSLIAEYMDTVVNKI